VESVIGSVCLFYPLSLATQGPILSFIMASAVTYITCIQLQQRCQTWGNVRLSGFFKHRDVFSCTLWFLGLAILHDSYVSCYTWHGGQMNRNMAGKPWWPLPWYLLPFGLSGIFN